MGDDPELEAIRQRRMAELMGKGGEGGGMTQEAQQQQEEAKQAASERRQQMLLQILQPGARERLSRIALVKPEKKQMVENLILQMAQRGQITEKVSEEKLIQLLGQVNEQTATTSKITMQRRRPVWDDDDD